MSEQLPKHSKIVVNIFGAVGYTLILFIYILSSGVLLWWLANGGQLIAFGITPESIEATGRIDSTPDPSLPVAIVSYIAAGFMAVTSVFVLVSLPYWLGKFGSKILKRAIRLCQISVTPLSLLIAKMLFCGLALIPLLAYILYGQQNLVVVVTMLIFIALAAVVFILQHSLAKMSRFEAKDIW